MKKSRLLRATIVIATLLLIVTTTILVTDNSRVVTVEQANLKTSKEEPDAFLLEILKPKTKMGKWLIGKVDEVLETIFPEIQKPEGPGTGTEKDPEIGDIEEKEEKFYFFINGTKIELPLPVDTEMVGMWDLYYDYSDYLKENYNLELEPLGGGAIPMYYTFYDDAGNVVSSGYTLCAGSSFNLGDDIADNVEIKEENFYFFIGGTRIELPLPVDTENVWMWDLYYDYSDYLKENYNLELEPLGGGAIPMYYTFYDDAGNVVSSGYTLCAGSSFNLGDDIADNVEIKEENFYFFIRGTRIELPLPVDTENVWMWDLYYDYSDYLKENYNLELEPLGGGAIPMYYTFYDDAGNVVSSGYTLCAGSAFNLGDDIAD